MGPQFLSLEQATLISKPLSKQLLNLQPFFIFHHSIFILELYIFQEVIAFVIKLASIQLKIFNRSFYTSVFQVN